MTPEERRRLALQTYIEANEIAPTAWADAANASESALRAFLKGETHSLNIDTYEKLARQRSVSIGVLLGIEGPPPTTGIMPEQPARPADFDGPGVIEISRIEYWKIGRFEQRLAAGPGSLLADRPEPLGFSVMERQWVRTVTTAMPDQLAMVKVDGTSMTPLLEDGDWVLIDMTQRRPSREGIYAIRVDQDLWIKRLTLHPPSGNVRVLSLDGVTPMWEASPKDLEVIGRVVWLAGRRLP